MFHNTLALVPEQGEGIVYPFKKLEDYHDFFILFAKKLMEMLG